MCFLIHPVQEDQFMPNPLSADIRARFELLFAQGLTGREIGRRLMISAASASRLSQFIPDSTFEQSLQFMSQSAGAVL